MAATDCVMCICFVFWGMANLRGLRGRSGLRGSEWVGVGCMGRSG